MKVLFLEHPLHKSHLYRNVLFYESSVSRISFKESFSFTLVKQPHHESSLPETSITWKPSLQKYLFLWKLYFRDIFLGNSPFFQRKSFLRKIIFPEISCLRKDTFPMNIILTAVSYYSEILLDWKILLQRNILSSNFSHC